jgi:catechol 2,3-dioxygenase-like lactoylglutathione lyase family enzyme
MPTFCLDHLHHETIDVDVAVSFYRELFGATTEPPFERGGATWVRVHLGDLRIMVTNRPCRGMEVGRYQGFDHLGLATDDFDGLLAKAQAQGVPIWAGPLTLDSGQRLVFLQGPDQIKIEVMEKA